MTIAEYFPELMKLGYVEPYSYTIVDPDYKIIPAGSANVSLVPRTIFNERGFAASFLLAVDNPLLVVSFVVDNRKVSGNFEQLKVQNLRGVPQIPYIVSYKPTFGFYEAVLEANMPFSRNFNITVSNPTSQDIKVIAALADLYIYKPGFYTALAKLQSGRPEVVVNEKYLENFLAVDVGPVTEKYL